MTTESHLRTEAYILMQGIAQIAHISEREALLWDIFYAAAQQLGVEVSKV
jgi:hypothetical protein